MFDPQTDPTGQAAQARARAHSLAYLQHGADQNPFSASPSRMYDAMAQSQAQFSPWSGWLQAMDESSSGKPIALKQGQSFNTVNPDEASQSGDYGDVRRLFSSISPSNQIGTGGSDLRQRGSRAGSIASLHGVTGA